MLKVYKIFFIFSLVLTAAALTAAFYFGLDFSSDFKGGSLLEIKFSQRPEISSLQDFFRDRADKLGGEAGVSSLGEDSVIVRLKEINEETHQQILSSLKSSFGELEEKRFSSIGAVIGQELKSKSATAIILVLLLIIIYIAFVFRRLSRTLSPWSMGVAAVVALAHDVFIPVGVFALLGHYYGVEISTIFVAAVLTIFGYSVADTVVVFDRIRENILRFGAKEKLVVIAHRSVMQTLMRSLNTTFTTLLSLVAIYFFGGETIRYFSLALIIGIFLGAYSSIFVATPMLVWLSKKRA